MMRGVTSFVYSPHKLFPVTPGDAYALAKRLQLGRAPGEGPFFVVHAETEAQAKAHGDSLCQKMWQTLALLQEMDADRRLIDLVQSPFGPVVSELLNDPEFVHKLNLLLPYLP